MNAPTERLEEIIEVLPGMKSPTVMPLAQGGSSRPIKYISYEMDNLDKYITAVSYRYR